MQGECFRMNRRTLLKALLAGGGAGALGLRAWPVRAADAAPAAPKAGVPLLGACRSIGDAGALKAAGYGFVEEGVARVLVPADGDDKFEKQLKAIRGSALPVRSLTSFIPGPMRLVGPDVDPAPAVTYAATALARAGTAGIPYIVLGSGGARRVPNGFAAEKARGQFIEFCQKIAPHAAKAGVTVVLEPLNKGETNFLNSVAEGIELVDAVKHPHIQLLADLYHMARENEGPEALRKAGARLRHCHIAEKKDRTAPGVAGDDFRPYFRALKDIGYAGGVSLEGRWNKWPDEARTAREVIEKQWAEA